MPRHPSRPEPNRNDPLSEPTVGRRLWAAYLARGWSRADFKRRMGVNYQTVDRWDTDRAIPDLANLERAAELLGYTVHELTHGRSDGSPRPLPLPRVGDTTPHEWSLLERLAHEYLREVATTFLAAYRLERDSGSGEAAAFKRARDLAHDVRALNTKREALALAVSLGARAASDFARAPDTTSTPPVVKKRTKPR